MLLVQGQANDLDQVEELNSFEKYSILKILKRLYKHKGEPQQAECKYFGRMIWTKICPVGRTSRRDMRRMSVDPFLLDGDTHSPQSSFCAVNANERAREVCPNLCLRSD